MEVLYHGIKTRYAYDFPLCFPHELTMSLIRILPQAGKDMTSISKLIILTVTFQSLFSDFSVWKRFSDFSVWKLFSDFSVTTDHGETKREAGTCVLELATSFVSLVSTPRDPLNAYRNVNIRIC